MKTLYLECNSGISGDMAVAALLDLGADEAVLRQGLASLHVDGYRLAISRVKKSGIDACDFDVILDEDHPGHDNSHSYDQSLHSHSHPHDHDHNHEHEHDHDHHTHEHQEHSHHHHEHRNLGDITALIDASAISANAKDMARRIFETVAAAEAAVHGLPVEEVHFHEVGAVDSIVDIVGAAICVDNLGVERVICSPLKEGAGTVKCQHGILPVPVPATLEIAREKRIPLEITDNVGEMVTPTGAAIAGTLAAHFGRPEGMAILAVGYGAGKKEFSGIANLLRALLIEENGAPITAPTDEADDRVVLLECNLDDMTGEHIAYAAEKLREAGALDVWCTPIQMKKSRPGVMLSALIQPQQEREITALLFTHTSTLGVRRSRLTRHVMERSFREAETPWGPVKMKVSAWEGVEKQSVEYESAREIADSRKIPIDLVYRSAYNQ